MGNPSWVNRFLDGVSVIQGKVKGQSAPHILKRHDILVDPQQSMPHRLGHGMGWTEVAGADSRHDGRQKVDGIEGIPALSARVVEESSRKIHGSCGIEPHGCSPGKTRHSPFA